MTANKPIIAIEDSLVKLRSGGAKVSASIAQLTSIQINDFPASERGLARFFETLLAWFPGEQEQTCWRTDT